MTPRDRRPPLSTDQREFECRGCGQRDTAPFHLSACPRCGATLDSTLTDDATRPLR